MFTIKSCYTKAIKPDQFNKKHYRTGTCSSNPEKDHRGNKCYYRSYGKATHSTSGQKRQRAAALTPRFRSI